MERRNEEGETPRKAGRDAHRRDLKEQTVGVDCTDGRVRGNHALSRGSGGFVDILTRISMWMSLKESDFT